MFKVYVNGNEKANIHSVEVTKRWNKPTVFLVKLYKEVMDDSDLEKGNIVKIYYDDTLLIKGKIEIVKNSTIEVEISGFDMSVNLLKSTLFTNSYSSTAVSTILSDIVSPTGMTSSTDLTSTNVNIIFEKENRLTALQRLVNRIHSTSINADWYMSQDASDNDIVNLVSNRYSSSSAVDIYVDGSNQNAELLSYGEDDSQVWTKVTVIGYGDGSKQISGSAGSGSVEKVVSDLSIRNSSDASDLAQKILDDHSSALKFADIRLRPIGSFLDLDVGYYVNIHSPANGFDYSGWKISTIKYVFNDYDEYMDIKVYDRSYRYLNEDLEAMSRAYEKTVYKNLYDPGHDHGYNAPSSHTHSYMGPYPHTHEYVKPYQHTHDVDIGYYVPYNDDYDQFTGGVYTTTYTLHTQTWNYLTTWNCDVHTFAVLVIVSALDTGESSYWNYRLTVKVESNGNQYPSAYTAIPVGYSVNHHGSGATVIWVPGDRYGDNLDVWVYPSGGNNGDVNYYISVTWIPIPKHTHTVSIGTKESDSSTGAVGADTYSNWGYTDRTSASSSGYSSSSSDSNITNITG